MIRDICDNLKQYLDTITWADVVGGAVFVVDTDGRRYPIEYDPKSSLATCEQDYTDYVPNTSKTSIMYWEDRGSTVTAVNSRYYDVQANIDLFLWINIKKINPAEYDPIKYILNVLYVLPETFSTNRIPIAKIIFQSQKPIDQAMFSAYTYDVNKQFLIYPFLATVLSFKVIYKVPVYCIHEITNDPDLC